MIKDILANSTVVPGNIIKLPSGQLDRKVYLEIKKSLELIGGKWKGGKVQGFVFDTDPTILLEQLQKVENPGALKSDYQFFETPDDLCDELLSYVPLNSYLKVLEPSAGQGAIIKAIHREIPDIVIDCYELMQLNRIVLESMENVNVLGDDFLQHDTSQKYDLIIANPPFSRNQDIQHVRKMYDSLVSGGCLISIMSPHWTFATDKKSVEFKNWFDDIGGVMQKLDSGRFKSSGTMVNSVFIQVWKE